METTTQEECNDTQHDEEDCDTGTYIDTYIHYGVNKQCNT